MPSILVIQSEAQPRARTLGVIATDSRLSIVDAVDTLAKARVAIARRMPELIVADLRLTDGPLVDLLIELPHDRALAKLALTNSLSDPLLMHTLRHGADAYLAAGRPDHTLLNLIHLVLAGESPMTPDIARDMLAHFGRVNTRPTMQPTTQPTAPGTRGPVLLSENELRVLQWTSEGYLTQEIARGLGVTPHEVGLVIRSLYRRMHADMPADPAVPRAR